MKPLKEICDKEFLKLIKSSSFNRCFITENQEEIKKIFNFVFVINYFKNRAETKEFFDSDFNMSFSLLLESSYALLTGQCRAALLLLRSAQEENFKFVLQKERAIINKKKPSITFKKLDYRFSETKNCFIKDIESFVSRTQYEEYYCSIERNQTYYKKLCGIVHSQSEQIPVLNARFFSNLYNDTILEKEEFFALYINTLTQIFSILYFLMRDSLLNWDTYLLTDLLHLVFGKKKTKRYIKIIKNEYLLSPNNKF